ncbi:MAG: hypothetical protein AW06_004353 [Candidatus Accumulibacter cognatus]|uniref:Uncharacterized protein n=1 Tax=Candidatus Accumulibacter cognatus TaxID=2954383 RepID=A0A080M2Z2_9PROT|nr:MAG: hypothetical protein AW06_004353 [Candidatus Accumulibacter cognatus]
MLRHKELKSRFVRPQAPPWGLATHLLGGVNGYPSAAPAARPPPSASLVVPTKRCSCSYSSACHCPTTRALTTRPPKQPYLMQVAA